MTRPDFEAKASLKGFQANAGRAVAAQHANTYVTLGLTLATIVAVVTVSIEVVTAAALL